MRRWMPLAASLLVAVLVAVGWGVLARAGGDGLLAWNADSGELRALAPGWHFLPRWAWKRLDRDTLQSELSAAGAEGLDLTVSVRWHPDPGTYALRPAAGVEQGLSDALLPELRPAVAGLPAGCLVAELRPDEGCPAEPEQAVREAAAGALGASPASIRVSLTAPPATVRGLLLAGVRVRLPARDHRVFVLGLDGLDWDFVLPLVEGGRMPHLRQLMRAGTWGRMETLVPPLSPLLWTSMATGVSADRHGILDFVETDPQTGETVPVTGRSRRVPAIWNVAGALGIEVAVTGWWATWPADRVRGTLVTDRLYYTLTQGLSEEALRGDPPEMVHPETRTGEFVELRDRAVAETGWAVVREFLPVSRAAYDQAVESGGGMEDPIDGFRRILAATRTYLGAGLLLTREEPPLSMVYLEGTDTIGHLLARFLPPPTDPEVDPEAARLYAAAVPRYFEIVDRWIGRFLDACPLSECAWLVVSDHGFHWGEERPRGLGGFAGKTAPLWHDSDAAFVLAGRATRPLGGVDEMQSLYDVTPTIAALLGIPAGASWRGTPLPGVTATDLAPIDYARLVPPASYQSGESGPAPADPEFIAQLRALGYLGEGEAGDAGQIGNGEPAAAEREAAAAIESSATRGELNNLAVLKLNQGEHEEARRLLEEAIRRFPDYPSPHYNLRRLYMETERYDEADRHLWLAVEKGLRDARRSIDRAAQDYDDLGLLERAVALLEEATRRYPDYEPFHVHLLVDLLRTGRCDEGLPRGEVAAGRFPESAPVHAFYGLVAGCAGEQEIARREITRSLELNPDQPSLRQALEGL